MSMTVYYPSFKYVNISKTRNEGVFEQLELREMEVQTGVLEHSLLQVWFQGHFIDVIIDFPSNTLKAYLTYTLSFVSKWESISFEMVTYITCGIE